MISSQPIDQAIRTLVHEQYSYRNKQWMQFKGRTAQLEPPSAAFVNSVNLTYVGPSDMDFLKARALSDVEFEWNPPAREIVGRIEALFAKNNVDFAAQARAGGAYYAGPYANKQLMNWMKPGQQEALVNYAFGIYRSSWWQEHGKQRLLETLWEESERALNALAYMQGDAEHYLLAGKSPETGVGYNKLFRNRGALARAIDRGEAQHVLEHDIRLFQETQQEIWERWPYYGTIASGFLGYTGSPSVSRSDVDVTSVTKIGSRNIWRLEAMVRAANITPISAFSTKAIIPRAKARELLARHCPFGYFQPMTKKVFDVFLHPPVTASFADECDWLTIDADWGFTWPAPHVEVHGSGWNYVMPKEQFKSGADGFIGLGSGTRGAGGWVTPEWSSGRPATRIGYEDFVDNVISHTFTELGIPFNGASNGDDQALIVRHDDVPAIYDTALPPYLRTKGSQGNVVFRWGKHCVFDSPDYVHIFNIPRPIKTITSANYALKGGDPSQMISKIGQQRTLEVSEQAALSAARTWEVTPEVFYMEGDPKDIVTTMQSGKYQEALKDAIIAGAVDEHISTYLGDDIDWDDEL